MIKLYYEAQDDYDYPDPDAPGTPPNDDTAVVLSIVDYLSYLDDMAGQPADPAPTDADLDAMSEMTVLEIPF